MKRFAILIAGGALCLLALPSGAAAQQPPRGKTMAPAPGAGPDTTRRGKRLVSPPSAAPSRAPATAPGNAAQAPARSQGAAQLGAPTQAAPTQSQAAPPQQAPAGNAAAGNANAAAIVTPQAQPAPAAPAAAAFTAGLSVPVFSGTAAAALDYGRTFGQMLDSTIVTLVGVFRNTSGQPISGATGPDVLSGREKDRWARCRNIYWDLTSYRTGLEAALPSYTAPALAHAARELDSALVAALDDSSATPECDNVSSMITAPNRWTPWRDQYEAHARHFYGAWYDQILNVHDKARAFVVALNETPGARRVAVPPALQRNPPYAGASIR